MPLWRIRPATPPHDARWQDHAVWEAVVRAPSAALARIVAESIERDPNWPGVGNESHGFRSAFEDEKLYWVTRLGADEAARFDPAGPPAVLESRKLAEPGRWRIFSAPDPAPVHEVPAAV